MSSFFSKRAAKVHQPSPAEVARDRIRELTLAMNERRPTGQSRPPLRIVSAQSLESELTDPKETPPSGRT